MKPSYYATGSESISSERSVNNLDWNITLRCSILLHGIFQFYTLTLLSLCNLIHISKFTLRRLFVPSYYLFNTTYFGLTDSHRMYVCKIVYETGTLLLCCCIFQFRNNTPLYNLRNMYMEPQEIQWTR
jgi:hypothetical protein